jgi:beta-glucosidase
MNYKDRWNEFQTQAHQLVAQMTLQEAASQLRYDAPAVERLHIPACNWWNEALHGVARAGTATVFPQAVAMAATFDDSAVFGMAAAAADEGRAKYNFQSAAGDRGIYKGLTFWSPNINIFRDPRWGRGQETYGEDPFLTARMGCAYVTGLQGDGPYLKAAACAKHFAAHSGPEATRHGFDSRVSLHDLADTYLPAFHAAVKAGVAGVMGAYNRINGVPACAHPYIQSLLREKWGFKGYFVSDAWALHDIYQYNPLTKGPEETTQMTLPMGCDLNCGDTYRSVMDAYKHKLVKEADIRTAAEHLFTIRCALGEFADDCPYDSIPFEKIDSKENNQLSLRAGEKSAVLLKNDGILPLHLSKLKTIGVSGPNADSIEVLRGNYCGTASQWETNLRGMQDYVRGQARVLYAQGCDLYCDRVMDLAQPDDRLSEAAAAAKASDVVVLCLGLDPTIEGEQGDAGNAFSAGDNETLQLPASQQHLLKTICSTGRPVVLVVNSGSGLDLSYAQEHCSAVLQVWYSGAHGGEALARLLFGEVVPSGRLPVTFYRGVDDLPAYEDYSMQGRTYRYYRGTPLYPFGYGLSYSTFSYTDLQLEHTEVTKDAGLCLQVTVQNTGKFDADEVTELYLSKEGADSFTPLRKLCGFCRTSLKAGEVRRISFEVPAVSFYNVSGDGRQFYDRGVWQLSVGGHQPDDRSCALCGSSTLQVRVTAK